MVFPYMFSYIMKNMEKKKSNMVKMSKKYIYILKLFILYINSLNK